MAAARSYRCLSCRFKTSLHISSPSIHRPAAAGPTSAIHTRSFTSTPIPFAKQKNTALVDTTPFADYTPEQRDLLAKKYSNEQMEIIKQGEAAIPISDIAKGRMRSDPARIKYIDDFSVERPVIDRPITNAEAHAMAAARESVEKRLGTGRKGAARGAQDAGSAEMEKDPHMLRLQQQTGLTERAIKQLRTKVLVTHRVTNQTRMGKIQSLYFLTIAGNGDGMIGIGEGKAVEDEDGRRQSLMNAIRNMKPIHRYEGRTIYGQVEGKVGASVVQLSTRPAGFGNRCQHLIFELARAAGISDLAARTPRSRNKMNVVKAAFQALTSQRLPDEIARARGRKLVDVRKVYYGGTVY